MAKHVCASPVALLPFLGSKGVSATEIGLDEVVRRPIDDVITCFTEQADMRSKPIFESTANMGEHSIFSDVVTLRIDATTGERDVSALAC